MIDTKPCYDAITLLEDLSIDLSPSFRDDYLHLASNFKEMLVRTRDSARCPLAFREGLREMGTILEMVGSKKEWADELVVPDFPSIIEVTLIESGIVRAVKKQGKQREVIRLAEEIKKIRTAILA